MTTHSGDPRPVADQPANLSTVELTERLTAQVSTLVRTEVTHALDEVKSKGTRIASVWVCPVPGRSCCISVWQL